MLKHKFALVLCLFGLSALANAGPQSSTIPFPDLTVAAGSTGELGLERLYTGLYYNLNCTIFDNTEPTSPNNDVTIDVKNEWINHPVLVIDSKPAKFKSAQAVKAAGSVIEIKHIDTNNEAMLVRNLDYTDNLVLSCVADVEH